MKKLFILILLILVILLGWFKPEIDQTLNIGAGFAAKNICSGYYNSGYQPEQIMQQALLPVSPLFQLVNYQHDVEARQIHTSILGLYKRQAHYRDGLGCTLLGVGQKQLTGQFTQPETPVLSTTTAWPEGNGPVINKPGIDYQRLNEVFDTAFSEPDPDMLRQTKAVLVIHQGELIAERYADPIGPDTPSLSWSMAKSITNLLYGTAVMRGLMDIYAPANIPLWQGDNDPRATITPDVLLRMSSGLEFNETYGTNTDVSHMLSNEISASAFAMDKPLIYPFDEHWSYASGSSNILSRILFERIGDDLQSRYDYLQAALFHPLGIYSAIPETDGSNTFIGSSYFYASPRDWAKLGQLLLQDGVWNGEPLLPEGWVDYSRRPTSTAPNHQYGAHFWLNASPAAGKQSVWPTLPNDIFYMSGYQGQFVVVVPSQQVVVVRLGYTYPGADSGIETLVAGVLEVLKANYGR